METSILAVLYHCVLLKDSKKIKNDINIVLNMKILGVNMLEQKKLIQRVIILIRHSWIFFCPYLPDLVNARCFLVAQLVILKTRMKV